MTPTHLYAAHIMSEKLEKPETSHLIVATYLRSFKYDLGIKLAAGHGACA